MRELIAVLGAEVPSGRAVAKMLRAERYSCALMASGASAQEVARQSPAGIILAGEAQEGAAPPDAGLLALQIPLLALGSSARALLSRLGARAEGASVERAVLPVTYQESPLFEKVESGERWIARAEPYAVSGAYRTIAEGGGFPLAFASDDSRVFLIQFQIERNDLDGMAMLLAFAGTVCGCEPWWTAENVIADAERMIREAAGEGEAICAMSGGLDSTVAAVLANRALGRDRARCVFVDTGLFRQGEAEEAERYFRQELNLNFSRASAGGHILRALKGLSAAHDKWRVIDAEIARTLGEAAGNMPGASILVKGTHYLDTLYMGQAKSAGQSPAVAEPLRGLFKDEVRMIGEYLSLSPALLGRQPFPGMGLAGRIHGEVDAERLEIVRRADAIFCGALADSGQDKRLSVYCAILQRVCGHDMIILRAAQGVEAKSAARLPYDLLERIVEQIRRELPSVDRVLYDMTPGALEWA